jgi:hypothetical protein
MRDFLMLCTMVFETFRIKPIGVGIDPWVKVNLMDKVSGIRPRRNDLRGLAVLSQWELGDT